jgi:selenide,water dikinase
MGGVPLMAIAIFGWPLDKLPPEVGRQVIEGGRMVCADATNIIKLAHGVNSAFFVFRCDFLLFLCGG